MIYYYYYYCYIRLHLFLFPYIYFSYFSYFYLILHKNLLNLNTRNFPCCVNIVMQWNVYLPLEATAIFLMKIFNYITVSRKFSINIFHVSSKDYCNDLYIYIYYIISIRETSKIILPPPPPRRIELKPIAWKRKKGISVVYRPREKRCCFLNEINKKIDPLSRVGCSLNWQH